MTSQQKDILKHLSKKDEILCSIIGQLDWPHIDSTQNVFHDLMSCIVEQQIHYRSTKRIFYKRMEEAGLDILTLDNFPTFEKKGLSNLKLSAKKYETLEWVIDFFSNNVIDWLNKSDGEVRQILGDIKGIGPWTIDMILLYTLERPDIFPADDYHLKKIMVTKYGLEEKSKLKAQMREVAASWSPYRSYGVRYLLACKKAGL